MSNHFEERSGVILCRTSWGSWYQTMEEVFIEVNVPHGTSGKEVSCILGSKHIELHVKGQEIFKVGIYQFKPLVGDLGLQIYYIKSI